MKVFGRHIVMSGVAGKSLQLVKSAVGIYAICRQPTKVLRAYIFKKKMLPKIRLRNGMLVHLSDNRNDIVTFVLVFCRKEYGLVGNKKNVIDVGANIGLFSLYAAWQGCEKIIAIEPNSISYATLVKNIEANHLHATIVPLHAALSYVSGEQLFIPKNSDPENVAVEFISEQQEDFYEVVTTMSLSDVMATQHLQQVNLLKMDCEGAEYKILLPMQAHELKPILNIIMEYHDEPQPLMDHLAKNGFTITRFKQIINTRIKVGIIEASQQQR